MRVTITKEHVIKVPPEVPEGLAEVVVTLPEASPAASGRRPVGIDAASGITVPEDFDSPLPEDLQRLFEGHGA
jgi:hypothetical protein